MRAIRAAVSGLAALVAIAIVMPAAPAAGDSDQLSARPGEFLIAAPEMGDPRFYHAVILMVQHDAGGAFGIIVNRPVEDEPLAQLLEELGQKTEGATGQIAIYAGGPVEADIGFVLHSAEYKQPETLAIDDKLAVTSSAAVLRDIATQHGPRKYIVAFGYAGWAPGQLENELAHRVWFTAPGDAKLLFDDDPAKLWQDALDRRERAL
jgi:putative transcriptional regulator